MYASQRPLDHHHKLDLHTHWLYANDEQSFMELNSEKNRKEREREKAP